MTWQTFANWYWGVYLLGGFCVFETTALATGHPEATLSETVWRWCKVTPGQSITQWSAPHILLALFLIWLFGHLVLEIWH